MAPAVETKCDAAFLGEADPATAWRAVPIQVTIRVPGYAPLTYAWRGEDLRAEAVERVLTPIEEK